MRSLDLIKLQESYSLVDSKHFSSPQRNVAKKNFTWCNPRLILCLEMQLSHIKQATSVILSLSQSPFQFGLLFDLQSNRAEMLNSLEEISNAAPKDDGRLCLCWLRPRGHLARSSLCCEEVREAWRRKQGSGVRRLNWSANKQTVLGGSSRYWWDSCRGSERVNDTCCFCWVEIFNTFCSTRVYPELD